MRLKDIRKTTTSLRLIVADLVQILSLILIVAGVRLVLVQQMEYLWVVVIGLGIYMGINHGKFPTSNQ